MCVERTNCFQVAREIKIQRFIVSTTKRLRIMSLSGNEKIRNHLVAKPIEQNLNK